MSLLSNTVLAMEIREKKKKKETGKGVELCRFAEDMILHIKVLRTLPGNCKSASGNPADLQDTKPTHRDLALLYTNNARGKKENNCIYHHN